ncbi:MAG: F0F1 ATP synthase subunit gamma [Alphaproteobacteria bacterium]|nr:MAG: F0F1 ATP synthase subunit gamma [Alphaproteobacteria bacterium]
MPNLRDYRDRIKSVKSTRKITSAMKMVAASKLRRAQEQAEASQPYARSMAGMLSRLSANVVINAASPKLLAGTGADQKHLIIVVTADRGLCGGFNTNAVKEARRKIYALEKQGRDVSIVCVGRKGYDLLVREFSDKIIHSFKDVFGKKGVEYTEAHKICEFVLARFEAEEFDICSLVYNDFRSILVQEPSSLQLIPFQAVDDNAEDDTDDKDAEASGIKSPYSFEPTEEEILAKLLPRNLGVQIFRSMLDSAAGEQAARMTAMDNATRNAGDMINDLTLRYNRARQAYITKELIEIISGAEAV